ncbi:4-phosphoerythronate dehydrogenase [Alteromonadaceae bacterium Bs31]|nr:4-phosphoerythronate dehydrogenase [Alteromonadaceae bacterium Bs31]
MKIIADENIPLVNQLFSELGDVQTLQGRDINAEDVRDADALLVRSVTQVNKSLLTASSIKYVGTCTIGTDHLDKEYLTASGIQFASAPGCNAWGVVQYVFAALAELAKLDKANKFGIIGCGNVGGRLYRALKQLGFQCYCYDPFLDVKENEHLCDLPDLYHCDVVCVHTPLTKTGPYPTYHMLDRQFFAKMKHGAVLLNAGRGAAIDNASLLDYLQNDNENELEVVLDVWEPEPEINVALLDLVTFASPHIAGYSFEGKVNGSLMIFESLCAFLGKPEEYVTSVLERTRRSVYGEAENISADTLEQAIKHSYNILLDDKNLRAVRSSLAVEFDRLRKNYPVRREFSHYRAEFKTQELSDRLAALGFNSR